MSSRSPSGSIDGGGGGNNNNITPGQEETSTAPIEGLALDRINDILDFEVEHILYDRSTRFEHYECLAYFWNCHPAREIGFGRRFVLLFLAELLVIACGRPPYERELEEQKNHYPPLYAKTRQDWDELEGDLGKIRALLLRNDATVNYTSLADKQEFGEKRNMSLAKNEEVFVRGFDRIIRLIAINKAIGPIRQDLEEMIDSKVGNFTAAIGQEKISEVMKFLETLDDEHVVATVRSLFQEKPASSPRKSKLDPVYSFVEDGALVAKLRSEPFDLIYFQVKFERFIQNLYTCVYGGTQSVLMKLQYTIEPGSVIAEILQVDPENRRQKTLNYSQGESSIYDTDDEENNVSIKEPSDMDGEKPHLRTEGPNKEVVHRPTLEIVEEEDEDMAQEESLEQTQSKRPAKRQRTPLNADVPPDPGIFDEKGRVLRRLPWTDIEKECVQEGVEKFGVGHWVLIKKEYAQVLRNRTTVQIKDCWRTISARNDVKGGNESPTSPTKSRRQRKGGVDPSPQGCLPNSHGENNAMGSMEGIQQQAFV